MEMTLFEIGVNILEIFITVMFLTLYFGCKYKGIKKAGGFVMGWAAITALLTYINTLYLFEAYLGIVFALAYFIYCILFLKGDTLTKLFVSSFINCILYSISLLTIICGCIFVNGDVEKIFTMTPERVGLIAIGKIMLILVCVILLKFRYTHSAARKQTMLLFVLMPVVTHISTVGILKIFFKHTNLSTELMIAALGCFTTIFLIYWLFISINRDIDKSVRLSLLEQKVESDKKNAQDIEQLYTKTCGVHHDLVIHFSTISKLLEESPQKAQEYINSVLNNQLTSIKTMIKTGNDCFDAIANTKIALCEKYGVTCRVRVMEHALDFLSYDEIAILFGNLFDNAIEAAKNSTGKIVKLDVCIQDVYLSVFIKNTIDKSVLASNKNLLTTKDNKEYHGFGIKNIKGIVDKHKGIIQFDEENGYFICDILIPRKI